MQCNGELKIIDGISNAMLQERKQCFNKTFDRMSSEFYAAVCHVISVRSIIGVIHFSIDRVSLAVTVAVEYLFGRIQERSIEHHLCQASKNVWEFIDRMIQLVRCSARTKKDHYKDIEAPKEVSAQYGTASRALYCYFLKVPYPAS